MRATFVLLLSLCSASSESRFAPHYSAVREGIFYSHLILTNEPWSIHIVRMDWHRPDLEVISTHAKNQIAGISPVSSQVACVPTTGGAPIAAVNGDFFVIQSGPYQGDPAGLQILNGEMVSTPREVSLWFEQGQPRMDEIKSLLQLVWPNGERCKLGLNETPRSNSIVLFTPGFGNSTRATNFFELILEGANRKFWLPFGPNQIYPARVRAMNQNGNTGLESNLVVLVFGSTLTNQLAGITNGTPVNISTRLSKNLAAAKFAIGGGPFLIHHGHENHWPEGSKVKGEPANRNPRTAVGYNSHYIFLVEVDGRQKELSVGMNFPELAELMKALGCTEAMNLDGGGSSTLWLNGKVMNSPSDKHERAVANALVIVRKRK